jgi:UDP-N-acetylmuramyl tripeptide synthase
MKTLSEWLAYCGRLHPQAIDMGLGRVQKVAERMSLHIKVPVITVAGTNGKGSTCAMLEAIYLQAGYKTGVYPLRTWSILRSAAVCKASLHRPNFLPKPLNLLSNLGATSV